MQLHLPSLFPATAAGDIFPSLMVQTAALLGLALVYQESGDRLMIECVFQALTACLAKVVVVFSFFVSRTTFD